MIFSGETAKQAFSKVLNLLKQLKRLDRHHGKPLVDVNTMPTWQVVSATGLATSLFFIWGLAYGMLDIMNYHVREAMGLTRRDAAFLALAYYLAYLPAVLLIAQPSVKKLGYRYAMIFGLLIVAAGMFFMSIGAQKCSFVGMVAGHLVIGLGVGTLERSANPYVVNAGTRKWAMVRLLVGQTSAAVGTVVAPYLANTFVFDAGSSTVTPPSNPARPGTCVLQETKSTASCANLGTVITFYRALALIVIALALFLAGLMFWTLAMPEVAVDASPKTTHKKWKFWQHPICSTKFSRLWAGFFSNWLNLGCQVSVAQFFIESMKVCACLSAKRAATMMGLAQGLFAIGRLLAVGLVWVGLATKWRALKPRVVLTVFLVGGTAFTLGNVWATGTAAIACSVLIMLMEAPSFPMNFEMATANFEKWQATAESGMILSISGGGILPLLMGVLADNVGIQKAWGLVGGSFGLVTLFPLFLNMIPSWRHSVDKAASEAEQDPKEESFEMNA